MNSKLHLAFLYASPLVNKFVVQGAVRYESILKIDYVREF